MVEKQTSSREILSSTDLLAIQKETGALKNEVIGKQALTDVKGKSYEETMRYFTGKNETLARTQRYLIDKGVLAPTLSGGKNATDALFWRNTYAAITTFQKQEQQQEEQQREEKEKKEQEAKIVAETAQKQVEENAEIDPAIFKAKVNELRKNYLVITSSLKNPFIAIQKNIQMSKKVLNPYTDTTINNTTYATISTGKLNLKSYYNGLARNQSKFDAEVKELLGKAEEDKKAEQNKNDDELERTAQLNRNEKTMLRTINSTKYSKAELWLWNILTPELNEYNTKHPNTPLAEDMLNTKFRNKFLNQKIEFDDVKIDEKKNLLTFSLDQKGLNKEYMKNLAVPLTAIRDTNKKFNEANFKNEVKSQVEKALKNYLKLVVKNEEAIEAQNQTYQNRLAQNQRTQRINTI